MSEKTTVCIRGNIYKVSYPECQGCENLTLGNPLFCDYEGEVICEYPVERVTAELATLRAQLALANDKIEDMLEYYRTVMLEPCPDEEHCTCVPALRKRAESAEKARDEAREIIKLASGYNQHPIWENGQARAWSLESQQQIDIDAWLAANPEVKE